MESDRYLEVARKIGGMTFETGKADQQLAAEQMNRLTFCDDDGTKRTFQEQLDKLITDGKKFPCFFASTEF